MLTSSGATVPVVVPSRFSDYNATIISSFQCLETTGSQSEQLL